MRKCYGVDACQGMDEDDYYMCIAGEIYGPCDYEDCGGACEFYSACDCECHAASRPA
jgi:hypothetical protein